jgi:hypothetical protein
MIIYCCLPSELVSRGERRCVRQSVVESYGVVILGLFSFIDYDPQYGAFQVSLQQKRLLADLLDFISFWISFRASTFVCHFTLQTAASLNPAFNEPALAGGIL